MLKLFRVQGDSMLPQYQSADYVLIARFSLRPLRVGDDIVSQHPHFGTILKRISAIEDGHLWLTGLNPNSSSRLDIGKVAFSDVIGRVILHIAK